MACLEHCNEIAIFLQGIYIPYVWLLGFRLADSMISRLRVKDASQRRQIFRIPNVI